MAEEQPAANPFTVNGNTITVAAGTRMRIFNQGNNYVLAALNERGSVISESQLDFNPATQRLDVSALTNVDATIYQATTIRPGSPADNRFPAAATAVTLTDRTPYIQLVSTRANNESIPVTGRFHAVQGRFAMQMNEYFLAGLNLAAPVGNNPQALTLSNSTVTRDGEVQTFSVRGQQANGTGLNVSRRVSPGARIDFVVPGQTQSSLTIEGGNTEESRQANEDRFTAVRRRIHNQTLNAMTGRNPNNPDQLNNQAALAFLQSNLAPVPRVRAAASALPVLNTPPVVGADTFRLAGGAEAAQPQPQQPAQAGPLHTRLLPFIRQPNGQPTAALNAPLTRNYQNPALRRAVQGLQTQYNTFQTFVGGLRGQGNDAQVRTGYQALMDGYLDLRLREGLDRNHHASFNAAIQHLVNTGNTLGIPLTAEQRRRIGTIEGINLPAGPRSEGPQAPGNETQNTALPASLGDMARAATGAIGQVAMADASTVTAPGQLPPGQAQAGQGQTQPAGPQGRPRSGGGVMGA